MTVRGLSELVLVVADDPACAAFYRNAVGLTPEREPADGWAWFRLSDEPVQRLALMTGPLLFEELAPRSPAFGAVHFAMRVERPDLPVALERLRAHGVEILGPTRFEWMRAESHYFYDPAGNLGEFWTPDP